MMNLWDEAETLARGAGEILMRYHGHLHRADAQHKGGDRRDLVSTADIESEQFLVANIPAADDILGEEGSDRNSGAKRRWIVDPLDGTVNFLHGIPMWCVSIGIVEQGELVVGVIHAPVLDLTFCAARGEGAFCNGEPIRVSPAKSIDESILATGFAYRRNELPDHNFDNFQTLGMRSAGVRRMGAAAVDLAFIASGRMDGFWELHLNAWDVAAGILLVREAGGRASDFSGNEELDPLLFGRNLVVTNGNIHDEILGGLSPIRGIQ